MPVPTPDLADLAERLEALASERAGEPIVDEAPRRRAVALRDHLAGHVLPRARSLDSPLVVLLLGPTGAGKSSLINALAGRRVSRSGVLRPTTRGLVVLVRPEDRDALMAEGSPLAALPGDQLRIVADAAAPEGVALVDAPDIDSIEHGNRELTDRLAEAADLAIFVTTAARYADRVPWELLARARDRGLPLVVLANRMPEDPDDRAVVAGDLVRLLARFGVDAGGLDAAGAPAGGPDSATGAPAGRPATPPLELLSIPEGALDPAIDGLDREAVRPLRERIDALGDDREARRALAARALAGSLAGLGPLLHRVADDAEHEAIEADALRRAATGAFTRELATLREDLAQGTFLRAEALRQWHQFVGADEITRLFSSGIGRVRGTISALFRGAPRAPIAEVRDEALADIVALARRHASEAARRTASAWASEAATRDAIAGDPGLWSPSDEFADRLRERLDAWVAGIAEDVRARGGSRRLLARGASTGVNIAGVGVMLATFAHTGGLTGAEVGVAAATAFLNQKLLEALFGEAALVEMVSRARRGLAEALGDVFAAELARFERLVPDGAALRDLAERLRAGAGEVAALEPALPDGARPVLGDVAREAAAQAHAEPAGGAR